MSKEFRKTGVSYLSKDWISLRELKYAIDAAIKLGDTHLRFRNTEETINIEYGRERTEQKV